MPSPAGRTNQLKLKLAEALGPNGRPYWNAFVEYVKGRIKRFELDYIVRQFVNRTEILALHNALLLSIIKDACVSATAQPSTSPQGNAQKPARKRKRVLPYQGSDEEEEDYGGRSKRLKSWVIGMGKAERDRLKALGREPAPPPVPWMDQEIARERGVQYRPEVPIANAPPMVQLLCETTKTLPTPTALHQRMTRIAAEKGLNGISPTCVQLLTAALDAHLKRIASRAMSLSYSNLAFSSVRPASSSAPSASQQQQRDRTLTTQDFRKLLTFAPSEIPNKSAAVLRMFAEPDEPPDAEPPGKEDAAKQLAAALILTRSGVREQLKDAIAEGRLDEPVDEIDEFIARMVG